MFALSQRNPLLSLIGGLFPTLVVVGIISLVEFPSWFAVIFVVAHLLLAINVSLGSTYSLLLSQCQLLQRDLGLVAADYTLQVVKPTQFLSRASVGGSNFFAFIAARPKIEAVEEITSFHAYPWIWGGTIVLSPSTPLGDKIQTFLLYHEIGHALSTSVTHHWYEGIAPIRELSRYLPASLVVHGWTATSLIGLLYLADCFTSMYDFDGPEIDADYIAARALLSQYGEKIANESIELACYALRRRAEVETNNKRKLQRREKILRRVWSRVPKSISADSWAYGPIFRLISLVRLVTMFAAFAVVFAYCKPVSEVGTLIVLAMLMGAAIQGMTMNWRLRAEVAKLQDFLRQVIDRPLSDQDSYDKLIAAFSPEAVAGLIMKPWFATTHFITK